jgi:hypothetical protein
MKIQAITHCARLCAAARGEVTYAVETSFISAGRHLGAAIVMEADIAGMTAVFVFKDEIDPLAVWSAARTAGAGRCADGILATRGEEKPWACKKSKTKQKGSHGSPLNQFMGGNRVSLDLS